MADPTNPAAPAPAPAPAPEPPKASDAAQKKQTVRISLPPKPAAGPSIKIPAPGAPAAPAVAPVAQAAAAPAAPAAARPPAAPAPAAKPVAAAPVAPARPTVVTGVGPLEIGLAFATVAVGVGIIVRLLFLVPAAS